MCRSLLCASAAKVRSHELDIKAVIIHVYPENKTTKREEPGCTPRAVRACEKAQGWQGQAFSYARVFDRFSAGTTVMGGKERDSRSKRRPWKGGWPTATCISRPGWLKICMVLNLSSNGAPRPEGKLLGEPEPGSLVKGSRATATLDGAGFPARPASGRSGSSGTALFAAIATGAGRAASDAICVKELSNFQIKSMIKSRTINHGKYMN
jgi:hypothetical protein